MPLSDLTSQKSHIPHAGLYVHIPFCRSKCPYCDFYSVASTSLRPAWMKALKQEIMLYKDRFGPFDTIYLGGGTPSLLTPGELEDLMVCLRKNYRFSDDAEITIEANPGDMDAEKISALKSLGFNRINLGVQSLDDNDLRFLGRGHSGREAEDALNSLRSSGFDNIGADLIYGLETQDMAKWLNTLERISHFRPEHLSCYQLTIEERTVFWKKKKDNSIKLLNEAQERAFYLKTSDFLEEQGYIHYEISNFSIDEAHCSRHNLKYWKRVPYLGLGPSSHSFQDMSRWWNHRSIRRYCEDLGKGRLPVEDEETLTNEQEEMEIISLGLRTREGLDMDKIGPGKKAEKNLALLVKKGYLKIEDNRVIPTKKGFLVADRLPLYFMNYILTKQ